MTLTSRNAAQQRADAIGVFRQELARLEEQHVLTLTEVQRQALTAHHDSLLNGFTQSFDIDQDVRAKQLSWGMRIASFLGALALAASVFFCSISFGVCFQKRPRSPP